MSDTHYFTIFNSALGDLAITGDGVSITGLYNSEHNCFNLAKQGRRSDKHFALARQQLDEYFQGIRKSFELPVESTGTNFQKAVWNSLKNIPYGETRSYGDIGTLINKPKAYRAVGSANGRNSIMIIVPCHRVIAADGSISGYAGGKEAKRWLLQHEQNNR